MLIYGDDIKVVLFFIFLLLVSRREEKFHEAARVNDASAIRALLREKVGVNCRNSVSKR